MATIAFSDIMDYAISETGHVALAGGADRRATRALASLRRKRRERVHGQGEQAVMVIEHETEIKLWDKTRALLLALRYLGLLVDRVEVAEAAPRLSDDELRESIMRKLQRIADSSMAVAVEG